MATKPAQPESVTLSLDDLGALVEDRVASATAGLRSELERVQKTAEGYLNGMLPGERRNGVRKMFKRPEWPDPKYDKDMSVRVVEAEGKGALIGKTAIITDAPFYHQNSKRWKYRLQFDKGVTGNAGAKERLYEAQLELA